MRYCRAEPSLLRIPSPTLNSQSLLCGHQECSVTRGIFRSPCSDFFQTLESFLVCCLCFSLLQTLGSSSPAWEGLFCLHKQRCSHWTSKAKRTAMLWALSSGVLVVCSLIVANCLLIIFSFFFGKMFAYSVYDFTSTAIFSMAFLPLTMPAIVYCNGPVTLQGAAAPLGLLTFLNQRPQKLGTSMWEASDSMTKGRRCGRWGLKHLEHKRLRPTTVDNFFLTGNLLLSDSEVKEMLSTGHVLICIVSSARYTNHH